MENSFIPVPVFLRVPRVVGRKHLEVHFGEKRYQVIIDGAAHLIYDQTEVAEQNLWLKSHRRLIEITNSLLQGASSGERLFRIYGGNDGRVMFLTEERHTLLRNNSHVFDDTWMPVTTTELR